jgi:hypothetical protein
VKQYDTEVVAAEMDAGLQTSGSRTNHYAIKKDFVPYDVSSFHRPPPAKESKQDKIVKMMSVLQETIPASRYIMKLALHLLILYYALSS